MLKIIVVEQHQHALEHIHEKLRKDINLLKSSWTMVHIDAHPDMACPMNIPAKLCFRPRHDGSNDNVSLYDQLDSTTTGIAEWILPIVLAGNLRSVYWIKPPFKFPRSLCENVIQVGVYSMDRKMESFMDLQDEVMRVHCNDPYYLDDDAHVDANNLQLSQKVHFYVNHVNDVFELDATKKSWMLDICLDYFVCCNPFLHDLQAINEGYAAAIASLYHEGISIAIQDVEYSSSRRTFFHAFQAFITGNDQGQKLRTYLRHDDEDDARVTLIRRILDTSETHVQLVDVTLEALPNLSMPHEASLPSWDVIQDRIDAVLEKIQRISPSQPFLVTIARSSYDGFCPLSLVDRIQKYLLSNLTTIYARLDSGHNTQLKPQIILDYEESEPR
jgi:UPF0489 domain